MSTTYVKKEDNPHKDDLLKVEEVVMLVGISFNTINYWYRWTRQNPEHELAKLLPEPIKNSSRGTRYWKYSDIQKLSEFKHSIPKGRYGVLGDVTQKYARKRKEMQNEQTE